MADRPRGQGPGEIPGLQAALADRYRLERELGAGGMARVFLAHDLKHDRPVAIKVLHPHLSAAIGVDRFLNEIRVAARFSHPHILGLIDSGSVSVDGGMLLPYYVMPFVEGESLRERLDRDGKLPVPDAVRIAQEVAGALAYAHGHGVVHRDIKPENILLVGGHAQVADFGVAKGLAGADGATLTRTGIAVGTPAYMSPEQAFGAEVDGRSDMYSLGLVLYEMLAGRSPFGGDSPDTMLASRLQGTPPELRALRQDVPPAIEAVVTRALARTPGDRFPSAEAFAAALSGEGPALAERPAGRAWRRVIALAGVAVAVVVALWLSDRRSSTADGAGPEALRSIAVLPFVNTGGSQEDEYFSDGMTDELAATLARMPGLRVAARSSAYQFKGQDLDVHEIGRRLGVASLVEGSVRRSGDRLRVNAQLVSVKDGLTLWSDTYERDAADVFRVQEELARAIASALHLAVGGMSGAHGPGTSSVAAHDLFLRGRYAWSRRDREGFRQAIGYFEQAIALDSNFARAWAGLGDAWSLSASFGHTDAAPSYARGRAAAERALSLDSTLADAHTSLGFINLFYDWNWEAARARFQRALELDPRYGEARLFDSWYLAAMTRTDEAIERMEAAVADEPASLILNARLGTMLMLDGRLEDAIRQHRRTLSLDPGYFISRLDLARIYAAQGRHEDALAEAVRVTENVGVYGLGIKGYSLGKLGRRAEAMAEIDRLRGKEDYRWVRSLPIAQTYVGLGNRDLAFEWLDQALEDRNWAVFWARSDPMLADLRTDPRWGPFIARLKFPPVN